MGQTKLRNVQYDISSYTNSASSVIMPVGSSGSSGNSGTYAQANHVHMGSPMLNNDGSHNSIYRGESLGTSVSADQYASISAGTFEDMYIGDYWTINDVVWRIWHFNYYYNVGDTNCTTNHVTIVPDTCLYNAKMNDIDIVTGAYAGSKMRTTNLETAKTTIDAAFGSAHILNHRVLLANAVSGGAASANSWYDSKVEIISEMQLYGERAWSTSVGNGYGIGSQTTQFIAPKLNRSIANIRSGYWLQDVVSTTTFAFASHAGVAASYGSSQNVGVRPAFQIIG